MMTSPKDWPRWPWLPVKRDVSMEPNLGSVYADDCDSPFIIRPHRFRKDAPRPEPFTYKNANEAFDDGWVVD